MELIVPSSAGGIDLADAGSRPGATSCSVCSMRVPDGAREVKLHDAGVGRREEVLSDHREKEQAARRRARRISPTVNARCSIRRATNRPYAS